MEPSVSCHGGREGPLRKQFGRDPQGAMRRSRVVLSTLWQPLSSRKKDKRQCTWFFRMGSQLSGEGQRRARETVLIQQHATRFAIIGSFRMIGEVTEREREIPPLAEAQTQVGAYLHIIASDSIATGGIADPVQRPALVAAVETDTELTPVERQPAVQQVP